MNLESCTRKSGLCSFVSRTTTPPFYELNSFAQLLAVLLPLGAIAFINFASFAPNIMIYNTTNVMNIVYFWIYTVSQKKLCQLIFLLLVCQIWTDFNNNWKDCPGRNPYNTIQYIENLYSTAIQKCPGAL